MRLLLVIGMIASMLFAAGAAYALGGGGHRGDGRVAFSAPASAVLQAMNDQGHNASCSPNNSPGPATTVPEPITAGLLAISLAAGLILKSKMHLLRPVAKMTTRSSV
jgi:hypothetical protein